MTEPHTKKVIHVGCGPETKTAMGPAFQSNNWLETRYDIDPDVQPDIVGNLTDMDVVSDEEYDALWSAHNIEHVYGHQVVDVLSEFRRVLKPSGIAVITCPNIDEVAKSIASVGLTGTLYTSPAGPITPLDIIYGHSQSIAEGQHYMAHKTGFSLDTLVQACLKAGFRSIYGAKHQYDLWIIGFRKLVPDEAARTIFSGYTGLESSKATPYFLDFD